MPPTQLTNLFIMMIDFCQYQLDLHVMHVVDQCNQQEQTAGEIQVQILSGGAERGRRH